MKDHRFAVGADLHVALDAVTGGDRRRRGAGGIFDLPAAASCRPRWAMGRAVSQSGAAMAALARSGDFEHAFDFDGRIERQRRDTDGRAGMAALVAEHLDHQVGRAVHHLRAVEKSGRRN